MYCINCGKKLPENAGYCGYCGKAQIRVSKIKRHPENAVMEEQIIKEEHSVKKEQIVKEQQISEKQKEIPKREPAIKDNVVALSHVVKQKQPPTRYPVNTMDELIDSLKKCFEVVTRYEQYLCQIDEYEQQKEQIREKASEIKEEFMPIQTVLGCGGVIGVPILLALIIGKQVTFGGWIFLSVLSVIFYYIILAYIVNPIIKWVTADERQANADRYYDQNIQPIELKEQQCIKKLQQFESTDEVVRVKMTIPEDYFDTSAVFFFLKMAYDNRADNLKEAINLYENFIYREEVKENQRQQSIEISHLRETVQQNAEDQAAYLQQLERNTQAAARSAKYANVIGTANFVSNYHQSKRLKQINKIIRRW